MASIDLKDNVVCIVGLGYVGLPLAKAFSKHINTIGFDIDVTKVSEISQDNKHNVDKTAFFCTQDPSYIKQADFVLICVPTPVTKHKEPDLGPVISAVEIVSKNLKKGAIVVLESTVYPGVTEEVMVPILEKGSDMKCGHDFKVGYSPERINPGDETHTLDNITKIVSGMDEESTHKLASLYGFVTNVYITKDIKTAEAAKVIENIQRDINIALMNELAMIFHRMGLDTHEVLAAAGTKWNFIKLTPGLVGGHCIPVDPYYMVYKARDLGYHSQVILAGRAINNFMPNYIAELAIKDLNEVGKVISGSKVLIMGLTYKENVPDIRESPVKELIHVLESYKVDIWVFDPLLSPEIIEKFGVKSIDNLNTDIKFDCIIITVRHKAFEEVGLEKLKGIVKERPVLIDVKRAYEKSEARDSGFYYDDL